MPPTNKRELELELELLELEEAEQNDMESLASAPAGSYGKTDSYPVSETFARYAEPTPSMLQRFKAGFMEKDIPQPKGFERGDVAEFAGRSGLETIGGTIGGIFGAGAGGVATPIAPATAAWGMGIGAAAGKAAHEGIRRGIGAFSPSSTEMGSPEGVVGKVVGEGAMQGLGGRYIPPVAKAGGEAIAATGRAIGKNVISPIVRGTTGVTKKAFNALIEDSKTILRNVGFGPDDIARKGQDLQGMLTKGKEAIEKIGRDTLSKHYDDLQSTTAKITEQADYLKTKAIEKGQELQELISKIQEKAGVEYKSSIEKILGEKSLKYGLPPEAAYPFRIDVHKPLMGTIKATREEFGYNLPGRVADESENALFTRFQNQINSMANASVDDVYYLQKDLTNAIKNNIGKPISAALRRLKVKVLDVIEDKVPEIRPANQGYRAGMELTEEFQSMGSADVLAPQIQKAFKYGGNKKDSLIKLAGSDPNAGKMIDDIVKNMDEYDELVKQGKELSGVTQKIGDLSITYKLGESKNLLDKIASKDQTIKQFLSSVSDKEELYGKLGTLLEGDNISKQIVKTMSEGGNKKDALLEFAKTNPEIADKIVEIQNAIFGSEFTPWLREIPATGFGRGMLFGGGALAATAPATLAAAPLFSPRLAAHATRGVIKGSEALGRGFRSEAAATVGRYSIPGIVTGSEELRRRYQGLK